MTTVIIITGGEAVMFCIVLALLNNRIVDFRK